MSRTQDWSQIPAELADALLAGVGLGGHGREVRAGWASSVSSRPVFEAESPAASPSRLSAQAARRGDPLHLAGARRGEVGLEVLAPAKAGRCLDQLQHVGLHPGADVERPGLLGPLRRRERRRDHVADIYVVAGLLAVAEDGRAAVRRGRLRRRSRSRPPRRAGPGAGRRRCRAAGRPRRAPYARKRQVALGGELALAVGGDRRAARALGERQLLLRRPRRRSRRRWR